MEEMKWGTETTVTAAPPVAENSSNKLGEGHKEGSHTTRRDIIQVRNKKIKINLYYEAHRNVSFCYQCRLCTVMFGHTVYVFS